jgi:ATP-dependent 26S proteasome regulatory subunit
MADDAGVSPEQFGALFKDFMERSMQSAPRTEPYFFGVLKSHFEQACAMARLLQPATLIVEDVDLVAEERTRQSTCDNAILFELLNQMDGLAEDSDILFLLTTNRPKLLEPALASRPGRVDLALEVPLPDLDGRRSLIELYGRGLDLSGVDVESLARKTEGVSGAFIKELLRKGALFAADAGSSGVLEVHIDAALYELTFHGGTLTQAILGGRMPAKTDQRS